MRKNFLFILVLLVSGQLIFSQSSETGILSGRVTDSVSNEGLPGVSVYLSGTKIGASSDRNGNYKIGKIPPGKYVVIVSMIGYAPIVKNIEITGSANIQKNFALEYKAIEMKAIVVAEHSDEYDAYFKEVLNFREQFKKFFLGQTDFSKECVIENIEEIVFDKKFEPTIKAACPNPIIVINNALGYKIECVMLNFIFNNSRQAVSCEFYPKFEELIPENENQKSKWEENRKSAFGSSLRRFLLSQMPLNSSLNSYGYTVPKATSLYKNIPASSLADSGEKFSRLDTESGLYFLKFKGFLFVNNFLNDEQSMVSLPFGTAYIGMDGCPIDPSSIQTTGVFAKQGVGNLLPIDSSFMEWEE